MKFLSAQLSYVLSERELRRNIGALLKYVGFLLGVIAVFSVTFHLIMFYVEGQYHVSERSASQISVTAVIPCHARITEAIKKC